VRRGSGDADHDRIEPFVEGRRARLDRAQQRLGMRDRRRPAKAAVALRSRRTEWITRLRTAPGSSQSRARAASGDALDRLRLVRVAAGGAAEARLVEHERDAEQGKAVGQPALELHRQPPAL
jgi:hypothetical protein